MAKITKEEEARQVFMQKPHVVIVGAGASRAAFPNGERNGRRLPLMDDFIEIVGLAPLLDTTSIEYARRNFEEVYTRLYNVEEYEPIRRELEKAVEDYFDALDMPDDPTIYDQLVLSMREKDVIATFNWDPFLLQARWRNARFNLPRLLFLHGNVKIGFCEEDSVMGIRGSACSKCNRLLIPSRLLYPVSQKDYHLDNLIRSQWRELEGYLHNAFMVTIFGYSAPKTDISAVSLLKTAWGPPRVMEEFEIIDTKPESNLAETWSEFIYSHHYRVWPDFFQSWLAKHPRRSGEAYVNQFIHAAYIEDNPLPKDASFPELWHFVEKLHVVENDKELTA